MDKLDAMKVFIEVAKHASFVAASEKLNMSAPAITRAIAALESRLGVRLFHRTTRQVKLTQTGDQYLQDAKRIIEEVDQAESTAAGLFGIPKGTLTITAPVLFGQLHISPIVAEFLASYSDVRVNAHFLDKLSSLLEEEIEVAIRIGHLKDSNLYAYEVGKVRRVVCASPNYLERFGTPSRPKDLIDHNIVYPTTFEQANVWPFLHKGKNIKINLHPRYRVNQNGAALQAAKLGFGITRLMSYQVGEEVRNGSLKIILEEYEETPLPVSILHLEGRRANAKVKAFIEIAVKSLKANPCINDA